MIGKSQVQGYELQYLIILGKRCYQISDSSVQINFLSFLVQLNNNSAKLTGKMKVSVDILCL